MDGFRFLRPHPPGQGPAGPLTVYPQAFVYFLKSADIYKNFLFLPQIDQNMKLIKLTALPLIIFGCLLMLASCEPDSELKKTTDYKKNDIPMTGSLVVPANTSTALGKLNVSYTRETRILTYSFTWSGLAANPTGIGIYGLAPAGFAVSPTTPIQTISTSGAVAATGTRSGTMLVDGVVVKEQDLLNGMYYVLIRTNNTTYPFGELRAQISFQ